MKSTFAAFLIMLCAARAADVEVMHDESAGSLSAQHKARIEAVRSLWDWMLVDNGLTGASAVVHVIIKPGHLGVNGPLASSRTANYRINNRGKLVLDGQYPVTISLNIDQALDTWPDQLMGAVVFHEMAHFFGMDEACFVINKCEGGTPMVPDGRYTGSAALSAYRAEYDPGAAFIPLDGSHFAELIGPDEILTPALSISHIADVYVSATLLAVIRENGWNVRPGFNGGLLRRLMPVRRLRDEDISLR